MSWAGFLKLLGITSTVSQSYPDGNYVSTLNRRDVSIYNTLQPTYRLLYDHQAKGIRLLNVQAIKKNKKHINAVMVLEKTSLPDEYYMMIKPRHAQESTSNPNQLMVCMQKSDYAVLPCKESSDSKTWVKKWRIKAFTNGYKIKDAENGWCIERDNANGLLKMSTCSNTTLEHRFDMIEVKDDPYKRLYLGPAELIAYEMSAVEGSSQLPQWMINGLSNSGAPQHSSPHHGSYNDVQGYGDDRYYPSNPNYPDRNYGPNSGYPHNHCYPNHHQNSNGYHPNYNPGHPSSYPNYNPHVNPQNGWGSRPNFGQPWNNLMDRPHGMGGPNGTNGPSGMNGSNGPYNPNTNFGPGGQMGGGYPNDRYPGSGSGGGSGGWGGSSHSPPYGGGQSGFGGENSVNLQNLTADIAKIKRVLSVLKNFCDKSMSDLGFCKNNGQIGGVSQDDLKKLLKAQISKKEMRRLLRKHAKSQNGHPWHHHGSRNTHNGKYTYGDPRDREYNGSYSGAEAEHRRNRYEPENDRRKGYWNRENSHIYGSRYDDPDNRWRPEQSGRDHPKYKEEYYTDIVHIPRGRKHLYEKRSHSAPSCSSMNCVVSYLNRKDRERGRYAQEDLYIDKWGGV